MKYIIYIDDTGTPSFRSKSIYDPGDWHSHVAVFIEEGLAEQLSEEINIIFQRYKHLNNFEEFHFVSILSGKDGWRNVDLTKRLEIFKDFSNLYKQYKSPIFIQSFTSDDIIRNEMEDFTKMKIPHFNLSKLSDLTLFFLLFRMKDFIKKNKFEIPIDIKVDSGKGEHMGKAKIPLLENIANNSEIEFIDSKKDFLMQFADFIAFSLNRMRWIIMSEGKGNLDMNLLQIFSDTNFEVKNLNKVIVNAYQVNAKDYDKELRNAYNKNGNLSDAKVKQIKKKRNQ